MNIIDTVRGWFTRARQPAAQSPRRSARVPGGRASVDTSGSFPSNSWLMVPPANYETNWQLLTIDSKALEYYQPMQLMEILADLSPEVSRALWDFLRLCNPGWEVKATRLGSDVEDANAKKAIDAFIRVLEIDRSYGSFDTVIGQIYTGAFLRGAMCAELVLDERGRMPLDFATPDPASIRFRKRSDPVLGSIWQPGQWQTTFVPLDIPTFMYLPIDRMPGVPYGRPMAAPALFTSLFLLGMLHDLKRVIQQQGYPRLDLSIDVDKLAALAPQIAVDANAFQNFASSIIAEVEAVYSSLKPDDAYIHTSNITVNKPVGAADAGSLGGIDAVITMLERMAVRALKTTPLMLGLADIAGDAQATRLWEIHTASIRSIQHYAETLLGRLFTLALEAQGIQAEVEFQFAELRASEALRDAQTEQMSIANENAKVSAGWITDDEASEKITGHKAKGKKAAPPTQPQQQPGIGNVDGQPTANNTNALWISEVRAAREDVAKAMERISVNGYH